MHVSGALRAFRSLRTGGSPLSLLADSAEQRLSVPLRDPSLGMQANYACDFSVWASNLMTRCSALGRRPDAAVRHVLAQQIHADRLRRHRLRRLPGLPARWRRGWRAPPLPPLSNRLQFTRKEVTSCIDTAGSDLRKVVLVAVDGRGVLQIHARAHVRCRGRQHMRVLALFIRAHGSTSTRGQLRFSA